MAFKTRFGNASIFARPTSKRTTNNLNDPNYDGMEVGLVTYHKDDHYLISSVRADVRSDHFASAGGTFLGAPVNEQLTTSPWGADADILCESPEVAKKREELTNTTPVAKPVAAVAE